MDILLRHDPQTGQPIRVLLKGDLETICPNDPQNGQFQRWQKLNAARDEPFDTSPRSPAKQPKRQGQIVDFLTGLNAGVRQVFLQSVDQELQNELRLRWIVSNPAQAKTLLESAGGTGEFEE